MAINRFNVIGVGRFVTGEVSFNSTDVTVEIDCDGLSKVGVLSLTHLGDHAVNDRLEVDESTTDGVINVPSAGTITIRRIASGTSGLTIGYTLLGN